MRVGVPGVTRTGDLYRYSVDVSGRELWYEAPHPMTDTADAAAVALLIPAMAAGEEMVLRGPVSEQLLFNLCGPVQKILNTLDPDLRCIPVRSPDRHGPIETCGTATGFSAGIDSFSVLADHHFGDHPRLTHLLFNNVGSHMLGERLWRERLRVVSPIAARIGLPLIPVNSNLDDFYDLRIGRTHTMRNASVALVLGFTRYLYASSHSYEACGLAENWDIATAEPFLLPLLGTETQTLVSTGCEYSRVQKTLQVAEVLESYDSLDVCIDGRSAGNCSVCEKCLRTQITLDLAGLIDRYDAVFDRRKYEEARKRFVLELLASDDPLHRDIVGYGDRVGAFTPRQRVAAVALAFMRRTLPRRQRMTNGARE